MAKKKDKDRRRRKRLPPRHPKTAELERGHVLWEEGKLEEALELAEELVERYPRDLDCRMLLSFVYGDLGDLLEAIQHLEIAARLSGKDPEVLLVLGMAYYGFALHSHALLTFRKCLGYELNEEATTQVQAVMADSARRIEQVAAICGIAPRKMEYASYLMEQGRMANELGDFAEGAKASKEAARLVPNWAPPRNNLALAYFALGQWDQAIASEKEVLERIDPQNVHALSNLARFLSASGERDEAQTYLKRLEQIGPTDADSYFKMAEAYAALEEDRGVYTIVKKAQQAGVEVNVTMLHFLGTAAANLGKEREALAHWEEALRLDPTAFRLKDDMDFVRRGGKKLAPAYRFPYFSGQDMIPRKAFEDFVEGLGPPAVPEERMEPKIRGFGDKYPYVADLLSDMLWYGGENEQEMAIGILRMLGSERAVAALRAFALSQVGDDDLRAMAATVLLELGVFSEDEPVGLWLKGQWREVFLRRQLITEERELKYTDEVMTLLDEAITAFQAGQDKEAEELYQKMITLEPNAKEAYGNLGVVYLKQGRHEEAEKLLQKALEVDPDYVFARCNLASTRITQGRLEEAEELLKPVAELKTFHPQELLFYNRVSAELFIAQGDYESAEQRLEMILGMEPEDEQTRRRLWMVQTVKGSEEMFASWRERVRHRRERQRQKPLKGTDLLSCLSRHTKDDLVAMASALDIRRPAAIRKAELITLLAESLADAEVVGRAWRGLTSEEQEALRFVLDRGGMVPYDEVSREYGDDLGDHFYWYYHEPETTIGRLRLHGLLFEGGHENEVVLVIPMEVQRILEFESLA
ncbi:MAG: tetratricopeptide repeat protein [Chloroflexi bacterium]|nr:tetratricopeptide repeat protein [Chloroflexota bacterium]